MGLVQPFLVLLGTLIGALAAIAGQLFNEGYKRHRDRQMTARGLAGVIQAQLMLAEKRRYISNCKSFVDCIDKGETVKKFPKIIENADIDPVTRTMLERVGLLGDDLSTRVAEFFFVLTGIRVDLVRIGNGEYDDNQAGAADLLREDLELWREFEPKARVLVNDLRSHAGERFSIWPVE